MFLSAFFFFIFFSLSTFPSTLQSSDSVIVQVNYPRQPISRTEGQPLTLTCTAEYEEEPCGNVSVVWYLSVSEDPRQRLDDPGRYLIEVSETRRDKGFRHRAISVTFTSLTVQDTGLYQCNAECQRTGATAMGRPISVTVTGHVTSNPSERRSANAFLLTVSVFLLNL